MQITVRPLRIDDSRDVGAAHWVLAGALIAERPDVPARSLADFAGGLAHPWPGVTMAYWLAELDGAPAGYVHIELPQLDNLDNAYIEIHTHPEYRRHGVGRAMYERAVAYTREMGRKRIAGDCMDQAPGVGSFFSAAMGARAELTEVRRELDVTVLPDHSALLAEAWRYAEGYSLVQWRDVAPEAYVAHLAALESRLLLDAPTGGLAIEPENMDADRYRAEEAIRRLRGRRQHHTAVRHDESDTVVGWTTISLDAGAAEHAWQQITIVHPAHRGHRLGLILKIENLRYALERETRLRRISTFNAAENRYMIAINERIGFRPRESWMSWQHDL